MVTFANESMLLNLITLWQKSFGDSPNYIRMFLDLNFDRIKTIVYVTGEDTVIPVSVAYLLPVTYVEKGKADMPCWYLYAAATLPEYRGRGYFAEILKFVEEKLPEPMILVPGEESLISYYEKQGMHVWLKARKLNFNEGDLLRDKMACVSDISTEEYIKTRNSILTEMTALKEDGFMAWNEQFLKYICHENQYCGGEIKRITIAEEQFLTMYRVENEVVKVLELIPQTQVDACIHGLLDFINEKNLPDSKNTRSKAAEVILQPTVMANSKLKATQGEGYFNLIMA